MLELSHHHRKLNAFPTRRSSDLFCATKRTSDFGRCSKKTRSTWPRLTRLSVKSPGRKGGTTRRDRKSTRLNSSHVKISYGVFCLKKKIAQIRSPLIGLARFDW